MPTPEFTITKAPAFMLPDGNSYATIEIAQRAALLKLLCDDHTDGVTEASANPVLHVMFKRLDDVKEILRCTGRRPRKAKGNGAARKRRTTTKEVAS